MSEANNWSKINRQWFSVHVRSTAIGSVVFLGKTLYSHNFSLHSGVQMGTAPANVMLGVTLR